MLANRRSADLICLVIDPTISVADMKAAFLLSVPKDLHNRIRFAVDGPGLRNRDCSACGVACGAFDPVYGEVIFVMWAHLDPDVEHFAFTVQGEHSELNSSQTGIPMSPVS